MVTILGFQLLYSSFLLYLLGYVGQKAKRSIRNPLRWASAPAMPVREPVHDPIALSASGSN
jgi:hypothetical protein